MRVGMIREPSVFLYDKDFISPTDQLFMGWAVGILGERKDYYQIVTHYGYPGYLKRDAVKITMEEKLRRRDAEGRTMVLAMPFADVLEEARVQGRRLATLDKGSFVECVDFDRRGDKGSRWEKKGFAKVKTASGITGYIPQISMVKRQDSDGYLYSDRQQGYFLCQKKMPEHQFRDRVVMFAAGYLNTPYRWAGKSQQGIDCSGLTFMCYLFGGVLIYRDAKLHPGYPVKSISFDRIKKGDLLYFPGHIGIYIGDGRYIHATGNENSFACVINSFYEEDSLYREDLRKSLYAVGSIF
ncbi:MAG: C40 family peptidase [Roseburia sp.]|nr:C40 family peptidase [Roseburia sp.]